VLSVVIVNFHTSAAHLERHGLIKSDLKNCAKRNCRRMLAIPCANNAAVFGASGQLRLDFQLLSTRDNQQF
jgi:hypothetical protein